MNSGTNRKCSTARSDYHFKCVENIPTKNECVKTTRKNMKNDRGTINGKSECITSVKNSSINISNWGNRTSINKGPYLHFRAELLRDEGNGGTGIEKDTSTSLLDRNGKSGSGISRTVCEGRNCVGGNRGGCARGTRCWGNISRPSFRESSVTVIRSMVVSTVGAARSTRPLTLKEAQQIDSPIPRFKGPDEIFLFLLPLLSSAIFHWTFVPLSPLVPYLSCIITKMPQTHALDLHEIRSNISRSLGLNELASCACVSRDWNDSFTPPLYNSVVMSGYGPSMVSIEKNKHLIHHLTIEVAAYDKLLSEYSKDRVVRSVMTDSTVTTLVLRYNLIRDDGVEALAKALKSHLTLVSLDLRDNEIGLKGARVLSEAIITNSTLTTLDLGYNSVTSEGAKELAKALKANSTLTSLDLRHNRIGIRGAEVLSEALKTNSTLTSLSLSFNYIKTNGAKALAEALKINSTLTTLNLQGNSIMSGGAQVLSEAVKANMTLTTLGLINNRIGDGGALALAEALKTNTTLTDLELRSNDIEDNGAQALSEALKINSTLTSMNLGYNSIGVSGILALEEAAKTNSTLEWFRLGPQLD